MIPGPPVKLGRMLGRLKSIYGREALGILRNSFPSKVNALSTEDHGKALHRFWQAGGGYDRNVCSDNAVRKVIEYIHNNPVRAGLVYLPEEYIWSSAKYWLIGENEPIIIDRPDWL